MSEAAFSSFPPHLIEFLIKSVPVWLIAAACAWLLRKRSAAWRSLVWKICIISLFFLPLLSMTVPSVPIFSIPATSYSALATTSASGSIVQKSAHNPVSNKIVPTLRGGIVSKPQKSTPSIQPPASVQATSNQASSTMATAPPSPLESHPMNFNSSSFAIVVFSIWLIGFSVCIARIAMGMRLVQSYRRDSLPATQEIKQLVNDLAQSIGLKRTVAILQTSSNFRAHSPMTWGHFSPTILLPHESAEWSYERLKSVLLHEFAHISRGDWMEMTFSNFICAVYWCHPLFSFTAREMRRESELACDDIVLRSGVPASNYASHLLAIAVSSDRKSAMSGSAISMAQFGQTETRLRAILDKKRPRNGVSNLKTVVSTCSALLILSGFAALKVKAQSPELEAGKVASKSGFNEILEKSFSIPTNQALLKNAQKSPKTTLHVVASSSDFPAMFDSKFIFASDALLPDADKNSAMHTSPSTAALQPQVKKTTTSTAKLEKAMANEKNIFWGKPVNGLQAGIEMWGGTDAIRIPSGSHVEFGHSPSPGKSDASVIRFMEVANQYIPIGETATFQIHIKNVGKTILTFSAEGYAGYDGEPFNWSYEVSDKVRGPGNPARTFPIKIGRQLIVNGVSPPPLQISLAPGAQFTIPGPAPKFRIVEEGASFNSEPVIGLKPGSYQFRATPFMPLMNGQDNWVRNLTTGVIKVGVLPPPVQSPISMNGIRWGEAADGLQAGISFAEDESHFKMGDRMQLNCFIRNTTNAPIGFTFTRSFLRSDLPEIYRTGDRLENRYQVTTAFFTGFEGVSLLTLGAGETLYFKHSGLSIGKVMTNKDETFGGYPYLENAVPGARTLKQSLRYRIETDASRQLRGLSVKEFEVMSFISRNGVETKREVLTIPYSKEKNVLNTGSLPFEIMAKDYRRTEEDSHLRMKF